MKKRTFIVGGIDAQSHRTAHAGIQSAYKALDLAKRHRVTIEPYVRKRTNNQNALYRKWIDLIGIETGNDNDDIHQACLKKFCPLKTKVVLDEEIEERSTKLLDTKEMSDYMDRVQAWAATMFNMTLPLPEDRGR